MKRPRTCIISNRISGPCSICKTHPQVVHIVADKLYCSTCCPEHGAPLFQRAAAVFVLALLVASHATAQTRVVPSQVENWQQVALFPPGTGSSTQIRLRQVNFPPDWTEAPSLLCAPLDSLRCIPPDSPLAKQILLTPADCSTYPLWTWTENGKPGCVGLAFHTYPPTPGERSFTLYTAQDTAPITCDGSFRTLDSVLVPATTLQLGDVLRLHARFTKAGAASFATFAVSFGTALTPACCFPTTGVADTTYYEDLVYTVVASNRETVSGTIYGQNGVTQDAAILGAPGTADIGLDFEISALQSCVAPDSGAMFSWSIDVVRPPATLAGLASLSTPPKKDRPE